MYLASDASSYTTGAVIKSTVGLRTGRARSSRCIMMVESTVRWSPPLRRPWPRASAVRRPEGQQRRPGGLHLLASPAVVSSQSSSRGAP